MVALAWSLASVARGADPIPKEWQATPHGDISAKDSPVSAPGLQFSDALFGRNAAELAAQAANRRKALAEPVRKAARRASRTQFAGLERDRAAQLALRSFTDFVGKPAAGPLSRGQTAECLPGRQRRAPRRRGTGRQGRSRHRLALVVDEVGYIPFDPQAANLMSMLVSRRYARASLPVTSKRRSRPGRDLRRRDPRRRDDRPPCSPREILALKGDIYRLKDRDLARPTPPPTDRARRALLRLALRARLRNPRRSPTQGVSLQPAPGGQLSDRP